MVWAIRGLAPSPVWWRSLECSTGAALLASEPGLPLSERWPEHLSLLSGPRTQGPPGREGSPWNAAHAGGSSLGRARGRGPLPLWCCLLGCFPLRPVGLVSWGFLALLGGDVTSQAWRGPPAGPGPWTDTQLWAWKPHLDLPARHTHRTSIHAVSTVHV